MSARIAAERTVLGARRARRSGFALLVVLLVMVLLSVSVGGYAMRMNTARELARSRARTWRLMEAARGAVEESKAKLWRDTYGQFLPADGEGPETAAASAAESDESAPKIFAAPQSAAVDVGGVSVRVWFEDEAGKLPVNDFATVSAPSGSGAQEADRTFLPYRSTTRAAPAQGAKPLSLAFARLFEELDLPNPTSLATGVRDFVDADAEGSGESGAKNARIFHLSELVAVRGFDAGTLYLPQKEGALSAAECMTTWYSGRVNINSASEAVLLALAPRLTRGEIEDIIAARAQAPFQSADDMESRIDVSADARAQLVELGGFSTDVLTLYVEARSGAAVRRVKAVVWIEPAAAHTLYLEEGWQF